MAAGSSPLTRGARFQLASRAPVGGLIPAHAGSTWTQRAKHQHDTAHPRSRGEHPSGVGIVARGVGSSPLTRGALLTRRRFYAGRGLIPAHAGSTGWEYMARIISPAHPRSRGEHPARTTWVRSLSGSSPLTRGALTTEGERRRLRGLIPAHAGSTPGVVFLAPRRWAHPRSRGEHV